MSCHSCRRNEFILTVCWMMTAEGRSFFSVCMLLTLSGRLIHIVFNENFIMLERLQITDTLKKFVFPYIIGWFQTSLVIFSETSVCHVLLLPQSQVSKTECAKILISDWCHHSRPKINLMMKYVFLSFSHL